jgi:single-strand DNA-binding protein
MSSYNKVILVGNLTRDPELRYTPSGASVCNFDLAVDRNYTTQGGENRKDTTYVTIVAWGKQAETCAQHITKGSQVLVDGRLQQRSWETPEGQKRSKLEVVAERVQFLGPRKNGSAAPESEAPADAGVPEDVPF